MTTRKKIKPDVIKSIADIDMTDLQDAQLQFLGYTPETVNVVFNEDKPNMLIGSISKEQGSKRPYKALCLLIESQDILPNELDKMTIDLDTATEIALTADYVYTNFGLDIHSHTAKNNSPFNDCTFIRLSNNYLTSEKYTVPKVEGSFYWDYHITNDKCYVYQETLDDRVHTKFICRTIKERCVDITDDDKNIYITI